jgi:hypothetical protein
MVQKWGIGGLKLYVNVVNAKVFSSWNYFDPEYHGANTSNLPTNNSPVPLTLNFGLNLTL